MQEYKETELLRLEKAQISPYTAHQAVNVKRASMAVMFGGFTIIEVMIVLAIAALIILVVLLAVPALQRSQRNNARKSDAGRLSSAVIDFYTNNTSKLPGLTTNAAPADCNTLTSTAGTLSQFNFVACVAGDQAASIPAAPTASHLYIATAPGAVANITTSSTPASNVAIIADSDQCSGANALVVGTNGRSVALVYAIESGNNWAWVCQTAQ